MLPRTDMQVDCNSAVLQPGESRAVAVTFRPAEAIMYREALPLHINGLYTVNVVITGASYPGCLAKSTRPGPHWVCEIRVNTTAPPGPAISSQGRVFPSA